LNDSFEWFRHCRAPPGFVNVSTWIPLQKADLLWYSAELTNSLPAAPVVSLCFLLSLFLHLTNHGSRPSHFPLSLSLFVMWRRVLGFCQFAKTITPAWAGRHHCHNSNPDWEKKIHYDCEPLQCNPLRISGLHFVMLAQLVCNDLGLADRQVTK